MPQQPPQGYRFRKVTDDIPKLLAAGQLDELCSCGHTNKEHRGDHGRGSCTRCDCLYLRWAAFIIPTT